MSAGTPASAVDKLHAEVRRALVTAEMRDASGAQGIVPGGMPPADFAALIRSDLALWKRTVAQLKIMLQ